VTASSDVSEMSGEGEIQGVRTGLCCAGFAVRSGCDERTVHTSYFPNVNALLVDCMYTENT
jgi:hypothetical protein